MPETALVTGASSGIGEQFARQLAARGHNLVLVARRADRLEALAGELPTEAHVIPCDLATDAPSLGPRVAELGVDVDLLVNNAGFGTSGPFIEHDPERDAEQVRVNCEAVVTLTHTFLPGMVEQGRGGIINVASSAGMQPIPYESVYAATNPAAPAPFPARSPPSRSSASRSPPTIAAAAPSFPGGRSAGSSAPPSPARARSSSASRNGCTARKAESRPRRGGGRGRGAPASRRSPARPGAGCAPRRSGRRLAAGRAPRPGSGAHPRTARTPPARTPLRQPLPPPPRSRSAQRPRHSARTTPAPG